MGVKVVLVGSSGGGGATEGHADVPSFVKTLETQLEAAGMELVGVQMIATTNGIGMDHAGPTTPAVLHTRLHGERGLQSFAGSLEEVNERARSVDSVLASYIANAVSKCDAVVSMSADVEGANLRCLREAGRARIPVTGTGGSSVSMLMKRVLFVGGSGSVSTTATSRAVSFTHALAKFFGLHYEPHVGSGTGAPSVLSVLNSMLPAFLAVAVLRFGMRVTHAELPELDRLLRDVSLPVLVCATVVHAYVGKEMGSLGLLSSIIAGTACAGSIASALLIGLGLSRALPRVLFGLIRAGVPATACSIILTGLCSIYGAIGGFCSALVLAPVRDVIVAWIQGRHHPIVGAIAGVLMCRGSKSGYYHSIALPIILIEMEHGDFSFVGSLDLLTLVCVSGGICAGVRLQRKSALAERGLWVNMCFGDMIEAAYPFMEEVTAVNAAGYLGSAVGGAILQTGEGDAVLSTAYMPVPLSILFAGVSGRLVLAAACLAAWGIPFIVALAVYRNR